MYQYREGEEEKKKIVLSYVLKKNLQQPGHVGEWRAFFFFFKSSEEWRTGLLFLSTLSSDVLLL